MTGAACLLAVVGLASPAVAAPPPEDQKISAEKNAANQIAVLQNIKKNLSPAEAKVDSNLVLQGRLATNRTASTAVPLLENSIETTKSGKVAIDIRATVSDALLADLKAKNVDVQTVSTHYGSIRAEAPPSVINAIAARPDVRAVEEAGGYMTASELTPDENIKPETKQEAADRVARETQAALKNRAGTVDSEGDRTHNADTAREETGVTGVGVKICALSDGVTSLAASQARGELPAVDVLLGEGGSGDEGTAMLEIIHDVAPSAQLGFATAFRSDASFADNIRKLRFQAGCDIIVDDIIYFREARFQDWIIAQAVNDVIADGALYFSSAGNEGNTVDGTAAHWEGDYVNSGQVLGKFAGYAHDFDPGAGTQIFQPLAPLTVARPALLNWADPVAGATNDYDMYLVDTAGNVVDMSQDFQNGTQDAYERLDVPSGMSGLRLAVVKFAGADRYLSVTVLRGRYADQGNLKAFSTPGVTWGHSAARGAYSTAAAPAATAFNATSPAGPFPNAYDATSRLEPFTSDGPRRIFFEANGTPITPGNFSATGGEVRQKPDVTGADGVQTSVGPNFLRFYGTSAAAPHVAAIAGLVLSGNPGIDPAEVRDALTSTALDIGAPGVDGRAGHGIVLADRVLEYTGASAQPLAVPEAPKVTPDTGVSLDPGESGTISVPVTNVGDGTASSTSLVLTTSVPGVVITPRSRSYGDIPRRDTVVRDFKVTVPATHEVGVPIQFSTRVSFVGSQSPKTSTFTVEVGEPSTETTTFAYTGAPVPIPDNSTLGASVQLPVSGIGRASKLTFSIGGTVCNISSGSTTVGIDHTFVGDLVGQLTSPTGVTATVFNRNGSNGHNMCQVVFDDAAANPFSSVTAATAPFTGTWRPTSPFVALRGAPVDGTWTFFVRDAAGLDTGSIRSVSLGINGYVRP
jgi:subtilisin-like proprotein convertase family protein